GITDRVGKRQQVVGARPRLLLDSEPDHFPTTRRGEGLRMVLTEVIAMRLNLIRQRAKNCSGISIGIGQRGGGRIRASSTRTSARPHLSDGTPQAGLIVGSAAVSGSRDNTDRYPALASGET